MSKQPRSALRFGDFQLNPVNRLLLRNGRPIRLTPKVFDLLLVLAGSPGRLFEKDELLKAVWSGTFVKEGSLTQSIYVLRRILDDSPGKHRYIVTVPGRGYRFVAAVRKVHQKDAHFALIASGSPRQTQTPAAANSIAVLPFRQLTAESRGEHLQLGLADALITQLSKIEQITVRPTSSVLRYGDASQDPLTAGRELDVDFVTTGAIQTAGGRIRVTVQVVRISDGATVWANKFDEKFSDIFNLEDSISEAAAKSLTLELVTQENRKR